jgi:serine/threonine-protein kinase
MPPEDQRRRRWWPWVVAALVLLIAAGGAAAYLLTRPAKKVVPAVVGQTLQTASANIQNAGLNPQVIQVTSGRRAGIVIRQDPQPEIKVNEGSTVTLTVSQGPGTTTVPSVSGLSEAQARQSITHFRLKVERTQHETSDTVPAGSATRTDPGAGVQLPVGDPVTLFISKGKPQVPVPDVRGQTQASAETTLRNDGFTVSTSNQVSTSDPQGTVISQTPAGSTNANPGSNVNIVIAQPPPKVGVPSVQGEKAGAATSRLTGLGLTVNKQTQDVTDKTKDGVVISQNPGAGSQVDKGSTVTITVGHFVKPTTTTTSTTSHTSSATTSSTTSSHT